MFTQLAQNGASEPLQQQRLVLTKRATGISLIILLGFIAAVSYHYYRGCYLQMPYPYNTFLFRFDDHFMDLLNIIRGCKDRDPYDASRLLYMCGYMPFGYLIGVILRVFKNPMFVFTWSIILFLLVLFMLNYCFFTRRPNSWMQSLPVVIFTFFTYPVLFVIDRGNFDMYIFMLIILFLWSFYTGHMKLAMLSLAMTIAIKIYTIAYIILFIQSASIKKPSMCWESPACVRCSALLFSKVAWLPIISNGSFQCTRRRVS